MSEEERIEALAEAIRADSSGARDLAPLEARFVRAATTRRRAAPWRAPVAMGLALAAAAVLALAVPPPSPSPSPSATPSPSPSPPTSSLATAPLPAAPAALSTGLTTLPHAVLTLSAGAEATLDHATLDDTRLTLAEGALHVAFHPLRRGEEHLAITTADALVEVVGTEFTVTRSIDGTEVRVDEGVVRVTTRATREVQLVRRGETVMVAVPRTEAAAPSVARTPAPRRPSLDDARRAADAGDLAPLEALAERGPRSDRLDALEALADHHHRAGDRAAEILDDDRTLALDPEGPRGATALYARAAAHRALGDLAHAADDDALYLSRFPDGAFAAQARARLCAARPDDCTP